jgi:shikimate kinase / 3-dehydroquinate synthase
VLIGEGALDSLGREVACLSDERPAAVVVADETADSFVGDRVSDSLAEAGVRSGRRITLPPGERAKTLDTIGTLWTRFREAGLDRTGVVVAVGGGAALDAAGFAAATFGRGVALANVPTTLLAMVDASLGGKVGIDHAGVKNLAGSFHDPSVVVADPSTLHSLPPAVVRAGLAECVKAAVLASPVMIDILEAIPLAANGIPADLTWIVEQSVRIKAGYVAADPFDRSLRQALNLGHTFAHGIEAATGYGVPHGEAVAAGLVAAARLGEALGVMPGNLATRLTDLLRRLGLPTRPPEGLDAGRVAQAMSADKKRRFGATLAVVPAPGGAELVRGLEPADLARALVDAT